MNSRARNITLLADRLCYLAEGTDGLRRRAGMWRSDKFYRDQYDYRAARMVDDVFVPRPIANVTPPKTAGVRQLSLFGMLVPLVLLVLLSACSSNLLLPTMESTPAMTGTPIPSVTPLPTSTPLPPRPGVVVIVKNVNVRDVQDNVHGWLYAGQSVSAACSGDWCVIAEGEYTGLRFWRGCSTDNPAELGCRTR